MNKSGTVARNYRAPSPSGGRASTSIVVEPPTDEILQTCRQIRRRSHVAAATCKGIAAQGGRPRRRHPYLDFTQQSLSATARRCETSHVLIITCTTALFSSPPCSNFWPPLTMKSPTRSARKSLLGVYEAKGSSRNASLSSSCSDTSHYHRALRQGPTALMACIDGDELLIDSVHYVFCKESKICNIICTISCSLSLPHVKLF